MTQETRREDVWDERATMPLIKTLESRDLDLRRSAAFALGNIRDPRVIEPLTKAVRDWDPEVRRWAMLGLGRSGDPASVPVLVNGLREPGRPERQAATEALAMLGAPAVPALVKALGHYNPDTQCAAAATLGRIADTRAVGPLIRALKAPEMRQRMAAAHALGELATRNPAPEVRTVLPPLRRLAWQEQGAFYREVIARIEAATAPVADLPIPAHRSDPPVAHLPVPASLPTLDPQRLPIPTRPSPDTGDEISVEAPARLRHLSALFTRLRRGRRAAGEERP